MFLTYKCDISRDNRRVLTLEAREEWGARGVLVGARILADAEKERQGAGRFRRYRYLHKHRTPVDGLRKHDVSLCLSYFSLPKNASVTKVVYGTLTACTYYFLLLSLTFRHISHRVVAPVIFLANFIIRFLFNDLNRENV